jgi:predicted dehydrogenase
VTDAQLRFGLIGTGYWAREVHAAGIAAHPDARLVGVWGRDPAKTAATATSCDTTPFDELGALLETVDAVSFAVPPDVQAALTPQVVAAGCHVLFEKPLAIGLPAADAVLDAVQAAGVASVVFFTERFVPEREAWLTGLGECLGAEAHWLGSLQTPNNPFADSPWRKVEGALWDVGPHALAAVLPVLGPVRDLVGARGPGDLVHLVLTHESGATSTLHLSLTMPPAAARSGLEFYRTDGWHARPDTPLDAVQAHRNAVGELIASARAGRTEHRCDARFGRDVVAVLDRAARALSR